MTRLKHPEAGDDDPFAEPTQSLNAPLEQSAAQADADPADPTLKVPAWGAWDPLEAAMRILAATGQPMLARQLVAKLERFAMPIAATALEDLLDAAARSEPRLRQDRYGRWRLVPIASQSE